MSVDYNRLVFLFMRKHKQPVLKYPGLLPKELADFRVKLIEEELNELKTAIESNNIYLIADALADLKYVVFGADISFGLPTDSIFEEVHRSNMTKEKIRIEGNEMKVGKGASYREPKIRLLIDQCIRIGEKLDVDSENK